MLKCVELDEMIAFEKEIKSSGNKCYRCMCSGDDREIILSMADRLLGVYLEFEQYLYCYITGGDIGMLKLMLDKPIQFAEREI